MNQNATVTFYVVTSNEAGQRIDNFLVRHLKGVPKSLIYRIIRKGEVRIDKKRIKAEYKLQLEDQIRIPPIRLDTPKEQSLIPDTLSKQIENAFLFEDENLIVINKPAGIAVHSGTHGAFGVIEIVRELRQESYLELVHRLDKETSGVLLIAKNRTTLLHLHHLLKEGHAIKKTYIALVVGLWKQGEMEFSERLERQNDRNQKVQVSQDGKISTSHFRPIEKFEKATLMEVQIFTGRMHQIRVQLAHLGFPIVGDEKYGDKTSNLYFAKHLNSKRLFLHAHSIEFEYQNITHQFEAEVEFLY